MFKRLFEKLTPKSSPTAIVEAVHSAGINSRVLETLPEAVLAPLKDSIARCQARPPATWPKELLDLVNRGDVSTILAPNKKLQKSGANILVGFQARPLILSKLTNNRHPHTMRRGITEPSVRVSMSTTMSASMKERALSDRRLSEHYLKKTVASTKHRISYRLTRPALFALKLNRHGPKANISRNRKSLCPE